MFIMHILNFIKSDSIVVTEYNYFIYQLKRLKKIITVCMVFVFKHLEMFFPPTQYHSLCSCSVVDAALPKNIFLLPLGFSSKPLTLIASCRFCWWCFLDLTTRYQQKMSNTIQEGIF